jgi:outer membrane protein TolC
MADNAVRAVELARTEVGTSGLPQITAVAGGTYTPVPPRYGYDPAVTDGGQLLGQLVVRQSLYDGGIRGLKSDQLRIDLQKVTHEREISRMDMIAAVKQVYFEALKSQEEVDLRRASLDQLATYSDLVRRLYNGGIASYADLLKAEMQTSSSTLALEKARESFAASRLSLSETVGSQIDPEARIADVPLETSPGESDSADVSRTIEMKVAGLTMEKGLLDVEIASHEKLPVVSLVADAGYLSSGENLRLARENRLNTIGYSIGVAFEVPILNWGATGMRIEQRELAAEDLRLQKELLRRSLTTETKKALLQSSRGRARLKVLQATIGKAEENFLLSKSKYAGGGALALEVLAAQQLLTDMKMDELQTRSDLRLLSARLERLTAHELDSTRQ